MGWPSEHGKALKVVPANIPEELKRLRQWVTWRSAERGGKTTKVPWTVDGSGRARSDDPATWGTFGEALKLYESDGADGIGFVFAVGGGYIGVDLDRCFDGAGGLLPQARALVEALDSYAEYSVSGGGLHVIVRGALAKGKRNGPIEVYPHGRYFTFTGQVFEGRATIREREESVAALVRFLSPARAAEPERRTPHVAPGRRRLDDDKLLDRARAAGNGGKFARLWGGDVSGYPSRSEADLALLSMLMFWTDRDEDRAARLFEQSGLVREKWKRTDYRKRCFEFLRGRVSA